MAEPFAERAARTLQRVSATDVREIHPAPDPWDAFLRLAHLPHAVFLDGSADASGKSRFSYIAASPYERIESRGGLTRVSAPVTGDLEESGLRDVLASRDDPLELLRRRLALSYAPRLPGLPPFQGGAVGLFGFGLARSIERLPPPRADEFGAPDLAIGLHDWVLAFDHERGSCHLVSQMAPVDEARTRRRTAQALALIGRAGSLLPALGECRARPLSIEDLGQSWPVALLQGLRSDFSRQGYVAAVERAIEYIRAGDVFQVNLSQRLVAPLGRSPVELYASLRRLNPAPFAGFASLGTHVVLSASPEHFLALEGRRVVTRPIKGTRPRGRDAGEDANLRSSLLASTKDRSENVMIVDLLRNDLSRVARPGSVQVPGLFEVETHPTVHHLVSEVEAELRDDAGAVDLLRAAFPGGSVTGAPKIRALEILAEIEPHARGFYCGSLGWIAFHGDLQLNLLIRTMTLARGWVQLPVGGGIVAQSDPEAEYEETLHKAEGPLRALRA